MGGTRTRNQLTATELELSRLENKQAAPLAGLARIARQSGQRKGKSYICGGRRREAGTLRPALVAACYNTELNARYQQLVAAGETTESAITAVMRKLVVSANARPKANRC